MPEESAGRESNMHTCSKDQDQGRLSIPSFACMAVIIPILSLSLPLSLSGSTAITAIAWVACVISAAMLILLMRSFGAVAICALAITFSLSYLGDPVPIALVLGAIMTCGVYSAAVASATRRHATFVICAPLLSAALAYAMTASISLTLLSLVWLPPALATGLASRQGLDRTRTVALFTSVAAIELTAAVLGYIAWQNGTVSAEVIEDAVVYTQSVIEWALRLGIERAGLVAIDEALLIQIRSMSASAVNLLPGILSVTLITLGFISHKVECSLFEKYEQDSLLESSSTPVSVSCTAALIFLAAHIFSFTSGASHAPSFIAIAAENISLVLLPALLLVGWDKVSALPKRIGFLAIAVWIGIVLAANALSASLLSVLALIGAFCIILARTDTWARDHYRKGEDQ